MDSKLQIISGVWRGRKLFLPSDARPTQNRARAALFNMMTSMDVRPGVVWDAFAGSGAFGIECMSRYPECRVVFSDIKPETVRRNLGVVGADARASVVAGDAMTIIGRIAPDADLIFVDPPYADAATGAAFVRRVGADARAGTLLIWEQDDPNSITPDAQMWEILRDKRYGRARFLIMRRRA